jgi:hypothetical protein
LAGSSAWEDTVARFTVRVELHRADDDDYETLHSEAILASAA